MGITIFLPTKEYNNHFSRFKTGPVYFSKKKSQKPTISSYPKALLIHFNSKKSHRTHPTRGLRQGDPLSPYLFLLCAEGFSALLRREESLSNIPGLQLNKYCPNLTHLFFADDNMIFIKAEAKEIEALKRVLEEYEQASGQTINLDKSTFMTSKNMKPEDQGRCEKALGIKRMESLGFYQGMPSQVGRNKKKSFQKDQRQS